MHKLTALRWFSAAVSVALAVCAFAADGGLAARRLSNSTVDQAHPALSPDGVYVACVETGSWGRGVVMLRTRDGLRHAAGPASPGRLLAGPFWLPGGGAVGWTTDVPELWTLATDGQVRSRRIERPSDPAGCVPWPEHGSLVLFSASGLWELSGDLSAPAVALDDVSPARDITSVCPAGPDGSLIVVDRGRVLLREPDGRAGAVALPGSGVLEYLRAVPFPGRERLLTVSRSLHSSGADRLAELDVATGAESPIGLDSAPILSVAPVPGRSMALVETDGAVYVVQHGVAPLAVTPARALDRDPCVSADGLTAVVASSGRDDTDGDGIVSARDPANLYLLKLP